jgi:UDP-N-acetyl-D-mannosaminuronic acid dehydrogenase
VNILQPGPGVGGHCIAVDPWFLVHRAPKVTKLIHTARLVNEHKPHWVVERVLRRAERFKKPCIACLGLAYKPDIDDLRESPAIEIVRLLKKQLNGELRVVEPNIHEHSEFELCSAEQAIGEADIVLVLVAHRSFKRLPKAWLAEKIVIDTCGALRG